MVRINSPLTNSVLFQGFCNEVLNAVADVERCPAARDICFCAMCDKSSGATSGNCSSTEAGSLQLRQALRLGRKLVAAHTGISTCMCDMLQRVVMLRHLLRNILWSLATSNS